MPESSSGANGVTRGTLRNGPWVRRSPLGQRFREPAFLAEVVFLPAFFLPVVVLLAERADRPDRALAPTRGADFFVPRFAVFLAVAFALDAWRLRGLGRADAGRGLARALDAPRAAG